MNQLGKSLVVLIAVASISFLGFATVVTVGGYNWSAHVNQLKDSYRISNTGGETPQWEAIRIMGGDRVNQNPSLPAVLNATYADAIQRQQQELGDLEQRERQLAALREELAEANEADLAALRRRSDELRTTLEELRQATDEIARNVQATQDDVIRILQRLESRRTDVFRLQAQLAEISVDEFRAAQIIEQLTNLIHQVDGELERARRREQQLIEQGARLPSDRYSPESQPVPGGLPIE